MLLCVSFVIIVIVLKQSLYPNPNEIVPPLSDIPSILLYLRAWDARVAMVCSKGYIYQQTLMSIQAHTFDLKFELSQNVDVDVQVTYYMCV